MTASIAALLVAVALAPPSEASPADPPSTAVSEDRAASLRTIVVRSTPVDFAALRRELAPRWPEGELLEYGPDAFATVEGKSFAFLEIVGEPVGGAPVEITLILSDGRAYVRRAAVPGSDRARALAIAIANLLGAVADEDVPPDREDASMPTPQVETAPTVEPTTPEAPPSSPAPVPRDPVAGPRPPWWELALAGSGGLVVGLVPAPRRGRPTFGGALRLVARSPRGLSIGASFRGLGQARDDLRLTRLRAGVDVGWTGRVRAFEWAVGLGPTVEPWLVTSAGQRQRLGRTNGTGASVLFGGAAFVSLGYRIELRRPGPRARRPSALRIGATTELATSVLTSGAAARVWLVPEGAPPRAVFAMGGLELWFGLDATLWFELPRPGDARTPAGSRRARRPSRTAGDLRPAPQGRARGSVR